MVRLSGYEVNDVKKGNSIFLVIFIAFLECPRVCKCSRMFWFLFIFLIFTLFCETVNLEIKNGRIIAIHRIEIPGSVNETRVDLTILALTLPPYPSIRLIHPVNNDTAAAEPASLVTD